MIDDFKNLLKMDQMKNIIFNKIKFLNLKSYEVDQIIKKNGLFVFPSDPGLSTIDED